jgi:rSAM-associated Gly-rich repeat protein
MPVRSRLHKALALLLPVGVFGASALLATAQASSMASTEAVVAQPLPAAGGVAARLQAIRDSAAMPELATDDNDSVEERILLAQWVNVGVGGGGLGWRNGGWRNAGGWGNGGWRNAGWRNGGWGNGGWRNGGWRNGGWPNFWHNW